MPRCWANLSGIAKGYGVDRAADALERLGLADYMVEVGGEIRTRGRNGEGRAWQLAIERPDAMPQRALRILPLDGKSLATSGDYRNFFMHQGRRYSHEIDPASAAPVAHALASVSVVADDCTLADAWSTALFVLGPERGWAVARRHGLAAYFVVRQGHQSSANGRPRPSPRSAATPSAETFIPMSLATLLPVFLLALAAIGIAVAAMAVGVMFKRPCLRGSCGGAARARTRWQQVVLRDLPEPQAPAASRRACSARQPRRSAAPAPLTAQAVNRRSVPAGRRGRSPGSGGGARRAGHWPGTWRRCG